MKRSEARAQALEILYESDTRDESALAAMARRPSVDDYARELVEGVVEHSGEIDATIAEYARRWEIDHMPVVDRNALRIGLFELQWGDVPAAVAMDQAIELCKRFSTDEAGRFVNGILAAVAAVRGSRG